VQGKRGKKNQYLPTGGNMKNNNDSSSKGKAVIFAREACELPDHSSVAEQLQACREYAQSCGLDVEREIVAQRVGTRTGLEQLVLLLKQHPEVRNVITEKANRLLRNFRDFITMETLTEELGIEVHLLKEGQIIKQGTKSQDKLVQGMFLLLARHYVHSLREEINKGINKKLEQGLYPGRAPFGYQNNRIKRSIEIHPQTARVVSRIFKLYATGQYSLAKLQKVVSKNAGLKLSTDRLRDILRSPFYTGAFVWKGRLYCGVHQAIVPATTHGKVQRLLGKTHASNVGCVNVVARKQGKRSGNRQEFNND
jgi:site-specific DNA recombinase